MWNQIKHWSHLWWQQVMIGVLSILTVANCQNIGDFKAAIVGPDVSAACAEATPELQVIAKRVPCEAYAGIAQAGALQAAVDVVSAEAETSDDMALKRFAVTLIDVEQRARVAIKTVNRAIAGLVWADGRVKSYEARGLPAPATLEDDAREAYERLDEVWRAAAPIFDELRTTWLEGTK